MVNRWIISKDRVAISKAGYDITNPALADINKIFDSEWGFNASLLWVIYEDIPLVNDDNYTQTFTVNFPATLDYVPAVIPCWGPAGGTGGLQLMESGIVQDGSRRYIRAFNNRITIPGYLLDPTPAGWKFYIMVYAL